MWYFGFQSMFEGEERLAEAAQNLEKVADSSIPIILNIIGIYLLHYYLITCHSLSPFSFTLNTHKFKFRLLQIP